MSMMTSAQIEAAAKVLWGLYHPMSPWEDQTREQQDVMCEKAELIRAAACPKLRPAK